MKENTWLRCHIHMYNFFGGVARRTVCDNLKTGVIKHLREGEVILNTAYEALGNHYVTAIMPAPVRKPKGKASVEGNVGKIATAIIARLRNQTFFNFADLKKAVREKLEGFNKTPFQKRPFSRYEAFQEEKAFLNELPAIPYEVATWIYDCKVYPNCHISVEKNFYLVPYAYAGCQVRVKITEKTIEVYFNSQWISSHMRFPMYCQNKYSTHKEDMPPQFAQPEMNADRMLRWAGAVGANTRIVADRIFASVQIPEQAYNSVLSVLKLSRSYSKEALEEDCAKAMKNIYSPRYRHLKTLLNNKDILKQPTAEEVSGKPTGFLRGAKYYGGESDAE